ncbi:DUF3710 domain-containing protein [Flexivirga sp. ID2601S]|uniref:DUF3710 domain-containing protein n=1 Tax=Flexivirga aerilata TaxID=1656889 RepID=A0A849AIT9_9MICO|nr:DUF3710 domain-containing protein [Flexivirga aerilata]
MVGLFRRKAKDSDEQTAVPAVEDVDAATDDDAGDAAATETGQADEVEARDAVDGGADEQPEGRLSRPHEVDRSEGPFDRTEVDDLDSRLDFGALAIIPESSMEIRLDVDESGQEITGMTVVQGESACQLQVFAAPKSSGVWDDIRDEIADNLIGGGGTAEEKLGPLGIELHARMPTRGPDGRTTYAPARFVGVDGPRWFLRAVLSGNAAIDEAAAEPLLAFIRRSVVIRGTEARAPREMLPLEIPQDVLAQAEQADDADPNATPDQTGDKSDTADDFKPFERGPEITEVR